MESIGLSEYWRVCHPPWLRARYHRGTPSGSGTKLFYLYRCIFYHSSRGVREHNYSVITAVATLLQQNLYHWPSKMSFVHGYNKLTDTLWERNTNCGPEISHRHISQWGFRVLFYYFIFPINLPIISLKLKVNVKTIGRFWFMGTPQFTSINWIDLFIKRQKMPIKLLFHSTNSLKPRRRTRYPWNVE